MTRRNWFTVLFGTVGAFCGMRQAKDDVLLRVEMRANRVKGYVNGVLKYDTFVEDGRTYLDITPEGRAWIDDTFTDVGDYHGIVRFTEGRETFLDARGKVIPWEEVERQISKVVEAGRED